MIECDGMDEVGEDGWWKVDGEKEEKNEIHLLDQLDKIILRSLSQGTFG